MSGKSTSGKVGAIAGRTLSDPNASALQRSLAGSALAQAGTGKVTGQAMEAKASTALKNSNASATTRQLAGSVTSQSIKKR